MNIKKVTLYATPVNEEGNIYQTLIKVFMLLLNTIVFKHFVQLEFV